MKIRTDVTAGRVARNHNHALRVRTTLRAGRTDKLATNHSEALRVRTTLRAGRTDKLGTNHNETMLG